MANILYVAYPLLTVAEESAGGAEQVLWTLEREMVCRRGAHTTVAASVGSRVSGELHATGEPCVETDDYDRRRVEHEDRVVAFVQKRERDGMPFDLIHDMSGSFWRRAAEIDTPVLATLHLPRSFYPEKVFDNVPENVSFNCVSESQACSFANLDAMAGVAPNGIALDTFDLPEGAARKSSANRSRLLWLGRICEEKAPHLALEIAARAGMPITIAGQVYPFSYHQEYFDREVVPRLKSMPDAEFVASPSGGVKRRLLRGAKALLITSLAQETSSLVAMEAAASGTPVIAFRHGALPEIVKEGVTGFIVDDAKQAVEAVKHIEDISSVSCVEHAQANFSAAKMAEEYAEFYARLMRAEKTLQFTGK